MDIYTSAALNPNTKPIVPYDPQRSAIYVNDPNPTLMWIWSPNAQTWVLPGFGSQQVLSGNGAPSSAPPNPALAAIYTDLVSGVEYEWNPNDGVWF